MLPLRAERWRSGRRELPHAIMTCSKEARVCKDASGMHSEHVKLVGICARITSDAAPRIGTRAEVTSLCDIQ